MSWLDKVRKIAKPSFGQIVRASAGAWPLYIPVIAYTAGHAKRGEMLDESCASAAGWVAFPMAKMAIGTALGGPLLGLALQFVPTEGLEKKIHRGVRALTTLDQRIARLECGGNYQDTLTTQKLRMQALQEMSGSLAPARRFLGNEASFFHGVEQ